MSGGTLVNEENQSHMELNGIILNAAVRASRRLTSLRPEG
jgi:hypothetical protein